MPTPSEHIRKSPLRGVWWVVVGLSIITLLAFAVYLIGLWLFVFGLLRKVATYTVVAVSIAIVGCLAWYQRRRFFSKPLFSLRSLLLLPLLCAVGLWIVYWVPRSQPLSTDIAVVGYYRGLGLTDGPGYMGKNWFRLEFREGGINDLPNGYREVDIDGLGYNQYRGYYGTGVLREEGLCMVVEDGTEVRANHRSQLQRAKFYDPNGALISEIKDGVGKQILCFSNGQRFLEAEFVNGKWSGPMRVWSRNGRLRCEAYYRNGTADGPCTFYFPNGGIQIQGEHKDGKEVGVWVHYAEDGSVASRIDHDTLAGVEPTHPPEPETPEQRR